MEKHKYEIALVAGEFWTYETKEDEKNIDQIQRDLANDKCVIIGNTIYTANLLVKITEK
jgi:hypothetical protein